MSSIHVHVHVLNHRGNISNHYTLLKTLAKHIQIKKKTKKPMGHIATVLVSLFKKMMKVIYDIEKLTKIIYSDFTIHKTYI